MRHQAMRKEPFLFLTIEDILVRKPTQPRGAEQWLCPPCQREVAGPNEQPRRLFFPR
jgi:hypothetical protein